MQSAILSSRSPVPNTIPLGKYLPLQLHFLFVLILTFITIIYNIVYHQKLLLFVYLFSYTCNKRSTFVMEKVIIFMDSKF
jgi:hypothetical protein